MSITSSNTQESSSLITIILSEVTAEYERYKEIPNTAETRRFLQRKLVSTLNKYYDSNSLFEFSVDAEKVIAHPREIFSKNIEAVVEFKLEADSPPITIKLGSTQSAISLNLVQFLETKSKFGDVPFCPDIDNLPIGVDKIISGINQLNIPKTPGWYLFSIEFHRNSSKIDAVEDLKVLSTGEVKLNGNLEVLGKSRQAKYQSNTKDTEVAHPTNCKSNAFLNGRDVKVEGGPNTYPPSTSK
jgi:hypothetical protein